MKKNNRINGYGLLMIFAASGFAGLIYQSIWAHYLGLILGHSAYAQVLVLALFMGGMALGAWLVSRRSELIKKPLVVYAVIEFLLGIVGVFFHVYFLAISEWSYTFFFPFLSSGWTLEFGRWVVASILILPQCILLGATFPLMSAGYMRCCPNMDGRILSGLYFTNSLGAAIGALSSTYILLPKVGLPGTVLSAGLINICVAIAVWPWAKLEQPFISKSLDSSHVKQFKSAPKFILLVAAITGASSFVYELTWIRMLSMVLGSTIHAFELMLAAFIAGIAFGGLWLYKRADRLSSPRIAAGWAQIAMGCAALTTLFLYNSSFEWIAGLMNLINREADFAYTFYNLASAFVAILIMFPTAFFAGMTLPLLTMILLKDGAGESSIGKVYAVNTLGAILGVIITIFVGFPILGLRYSLLFAAAADIVIGISLLMVFGRVSWSNFILLGQKTRMGIIATIAFLSFSVIFSNFDTALMSAGVFRYGNLFVNNSEQAVLFYKDGRTASVALKEAEGVRTIVTNGKPDAGVAMPILSKLNLDKQKTEEVEPTDDETTMASLATIPMVYNPNAKSVAIIGFGSGMSTHFILGNPSITQVDTVEIEPAMVEAAHYFRPVVERAFTDLRSQIIIDDAKSYFATNRKKYDLIISEPSNPWVSGVASLFSEEFYQFIPRHLSQDGLFVQWLQNYEISPALIASIIKAMSPHFEDIHAFQVGVGQDWVLVAKPFQKLPRLDTLMIPRDWTAQLHTELVARGLATEQDLSLRYFADKKILTIYASLYPLVQANSDFFPVLQLHAPKARFNGGGSSELEQQIKMADWPMFEVLTNWQPIPIDTTISKRTIHDSRYATGVAQARELNAIMTGVSAINTTGYAGNYAQFTASHMRKIGIACEFDNLTEHDALLFILSLAAQTIPYLRAEDSYDLWIKPNWIGGCKPTNPLVQSYLLLIGNIAERNYKETILIGQKILDDHKDSLSKQNMTMIKSYIVGSMQMSAYGMEDYSAVIRLHQKYGGEIPADFAHTFLVRASELKLKSML